MQTDHAGEVFRRSPAQKILFLLLIGAAIFTLPYFAPVHQAVSTAYVAGFNNRVAVLLMLGGTALFAFFTRGELARMEEADTRLSVPVLLLSLALVLVLCLARIHSVPMGSRVDESLFFLNRLQLVAAGYLPYRQFDIPYGPLLLYPAYWITRGLHVSIAQGYGAWWTIQWLAGTAMMWAVVRWVDFPVRWRLGVYGLLFAMQLVGLRTGGSNYTPFRAYMAAFLVFAAWRVWRRWGNPWLMAVVSVLAVTVATLFSMEQAVGVEFGLGCYLFLLAAMRKVKFPWAAFAVYVVGCVLSYKLAEWMGLFISFKAWAAGGLSNPVLPSPAIALGLLAYVAAGCLLIRRLLDGRFDSAVIPLTTAGCAMMSSVLGRCDMQHIYAAMPAFVVGVAALGAMPAVRRWWLPLAALVLIVVPVLLNSPRARQRLGFPADPEPAAENVPHAPGAKPVVLETAPELNFVSSEFPCDRKYFMPSMAPSPLQPFRPQCQESGYFYAMGDVITAVGIEMKLDEMRARPNEPLVLHNTPLEEEFKPDQTDLAGLRMQEVSLYVPRARNPPLTYQPMIDYIREHYAPGAVVMDGRFRVWEPRGHAQASR
jgi:hypothetical protein